MRNQIFAFLVALAVFAGCSRPQAEEGKSAAAQESWRKIDTAFANPPAEFRFIQYSKHDGALLPYDKMAEAGIGGGDAFYAVRRLPGKGSGMGKCPQKS